MSRLILLHFNTETDNNSPLRKREFMNIDRVQKSLGWAIVASETSHVFCCVLPTLFSLISLAAGLGLVTAMPLGLEVLHEVMHHWELPVILASGVVLLLGWGAHFLALKLDCRSTGCGHGPCTPKKRKAGKVLKLATVLFVMNFAIYLGFHHGLEAVFSFII